MSTEPEPNKNSPDQSNQNDESASQNQAAREAAAKALEQAKDGIQTGVATFKKLDFLTQIYLAGLTVAFLCAIFFSFMTTSFKIEGPGSELLSEMKSGHSVTAFHAGRSGKLAVLAAIAGIGVWIWNRVSKKKEAWVPLALAGCAGGSALMFLVLMLRSSGGSTTETPVAGFTVDVDMTFLGFWVPFAGAIAATIVAVKRILAAGNPK